MHRPILGDVNIFEGINCQRFIDHIEELETYCNDIEQRLEKVIQQYKDALHELRFP